MFTSEKEDADWCSRQQKEMQIGAHVSKRRSNVHISKRRCRLVFTSAEGDVDWCSRQQKESGKKQKKQRNKENEMIDKYI